MRLLSNSKRIFVSAVLSVLSFAVAVCAVLAWFSLSGSSSYFINVGVTEGYDIDIFISYDNKVYTKFENEEMDVTFDDMFCGNANSRTLYIKFNNNDRKDIFVSLSLLMHTEIPHIEENQYYYLGSQLQISDIHATKSGEYYDISDGCQGEGKYLVTTESSASDKGQVTSLPDRIDNIGNLSLINDLNLVKNESVTIGITFIFVDNNENQSIYQSPFSGLSKRILSLFYKEE